MEGIRHRRMVILLTSATVILVAFSLTSPWFSLTARNTAMPSGTPYSTDQYWLHLDYYRYSINTGSNSWHTYSSYYDMFQSNLKNLGSFEKDVMLVWTLLVLAFLGLTLANRRGPCIGVGLIMVATMAFAVAVFAATVGTAVSAAQSEGGPWFPSFGSFFGSMVYGGGRVTLSWGPGLGWFLALGACVMQTVALLLGATRVLPSKREPITDSPT
jgi:hypothetical protein